MLQSTIAIPTRTYLGGAGRMQFLGNARVQLLRDAAEIAADATANPVSSGPSLSTVALLLGGLAVGAAAFHGWKASKRRR